MNIIICVTQYTTKADGQYCDENVKNIYISNTGLISFMHLPGNKLTSMETPGWVAATAESRGRVKAVSTRGRAAGGKLRPGYHEVYIRLKAMPDKVRVT